MYVWVRVRVRVRVCVCVRVCERVCVYIYMVTCVTYVGTFLYMSPERFGSEPYSFPSDVWSFGLSMMECCTGQCSYSSIYIYIIHICIYIYTKLYI